MTEQIQDMQSETELTEAKKPETYGELLKDARESKGLSVESVASQLRLAPKQIQGLESSDPATFAQVVYTRAHLRSYARLLGLDESAVIAMFNNSLGSEDKDQKSFIRKTTNSLRPYREETTKNGKGKGLGLLVFLAVLCLVGYMGWRYVEPEIDIEEIKSQVMSLIDRSEKPAETTKQAEPAPTPAAAVSEVKPEPQAQATKAQPETAAAELAPAHVEEGRVLATNQQERELEQKIVAEELAKREAEAKQAEEEAAKQKEAERQRLEAEKQRQDAINHSPLPLIQSRDGSWEVAVPNAEAKEITVLFKAVDGDCWFGIYQDEKLTQNTTLKDGNEKEYKTSLPVRIRLGNRPHASVLLDGHPVDLTNSTRNNFSFIARAM